MSIEDYEVVIGLEIHAELSTKTKIFCNCSTEFGAEPNTHVCPVCMAMPGALPVLNEKVVEYAVKAGLATNCTISKDSKNDRKNYFYPDLPKSYQISQFDKPLCEHGYIEIETTEGKKKIRLLRIHIEEDAGKLNHDDFGGGSLVDLNRAGVPLIEMVSEPDLRSAEEVEAYLRKLKSILEYIEVSDCKMQEGSLRADVNVSVHKKGTPFGDAFNGITQAGWFSICLAIMCLVKIDGKPAANPFTVLKDGVDWNVIYAMIGFTQAGAVLTMDDAGIKTWLQDVLSGIFVNSGFPVFLLLVVLISWILTNFLSNTAVGVIMASLASPFLTVHIQQSGINPTAYAAGFMISVMFAFATQAACGAAPLLFGNKCISNDLKWLYSKGLFAGIIIFLINYILTLGLCYIL